MTRRLPLLSVLLTLTVTACEDAEIGTDRIFGPDQSIAPFSNGGTGQTGLYWCEVLQDTRVGSLPALPQRIPVRFKERALSPDHSTFVYRVVTQDPKSSVAAITTCTIPRTDAAVHAMAALFGMDSQRLPRRVGQLRAPTQSSVELGTALHQRRKKIDPFAPRPEDRGGNPTADPEPGDGAIFMGEIEGVTVYGTSQNWYWYLMGYLGYYDFNSGAYDAYFTTEYSGGGDYAGSIDDDRSGMEDGTPLGAGCGTQIMDALNPTQCARVAAAIEAVRTNPPHPQCLTFANSAKYRLESLNKFVYYENSGGKNYYGVSYMGSGDIGLSSRAFNESGELAKTIFHEEAHHHGWPDRKNNDGSLNAPNPVDNKYAEDWGQICGSGVSA